MFSDTDEVARPAMAGAERSEVARRQNKHVPTALGEHGVGAAEPDLHTTFDA